MGGNIQTEINFLVRDLKHEHEKPYEIRYDLKDDFPRTNTVNKGQTVVVQDFRPLGGPNNFEEFGFSVENLDTPLTKEVFEKPEIVTQLHYPAIERLLRNKFPDASGVYVLEHNLRRRHAQFPTVEDGIEVETTQPATLAHLDCSIEFTKRTAKAVFNLDEQSYKRLIAVNLWKSLQGRGNDWPLAFCDHRTIDHRADTIITDVVYHNRFTENENLYHNPEQQWYWVKDLGDEEILLFLQKDSTVEGGGGVAHASFHNPEVEANAAPRESIEFRAYVTF